MPELSAEHSQRLPSPPEALGHGARSRMRDFSLVLLVRTLSLTTLGMVLFALSVTLFERTRSATLYGWITFVFVTPEVVLAPLAGALIDRWDRRRVLLLSHLGVGSCSLLLVLLCWMGRLEVLPLMLLVALTSCFMAFQFSCLAAVTPLLVEPRQLGRASGMMQLGSGVAQLGAPLLAGMLLTSIHLMSILLLDVAGCIIAIGVLLKVRIPRPPPCAEGEAAQGKLLQDVAYGWTYLRRRPGLMGSLLLLALTHFGLGMVQVILAPIVLRSGDAATLGIVMSAAGVGILAGSLVMVFWKGPKRLIHGILAFTVLQGLMFLVAAFLTSPRLFAVGAFGMLFAFPFIAGWSQVLWQRKVVPAVQGRLFAFQTLVSRGTMPLAYLVAGPLMDKVFEPLMAVDGRLAGSAGQLLGTGPGRGAALLLVCLGGLIILGAVVGALHRRTRAVEQELPDNPSPLQASAVEASGGLPVEVSRT